MRHVLFAYVMGFNGTKVPVNPHLITHIDSFYEHGKKLFGNSIIYLGVNGIRVQGEPEEVAKKIEEQIFDIEILQ